MSVLIVDGHLDLALNAIQGNRDLERSAYETRVAEFGRPGKGVAQGTVALPEMRLGRVALSFATVIARSTGQVAFHIDYATPSQAYAVAQSHLAYYRALERAGLATVITTVGELDDHMAAWEAWAAHEQRPSSETPRLGFVLLMESADSILEPSELGSWWNAGLRMVGPAHTGRGRYAGGTGSEAGLTPAGFELLEEMERLGMTLDVTHLSDRAFWQALERFGGPILASHDNCRALVPVQRQLADDQIRALAERDGVIGVLVGCSDLAAGWVVGARHNAAVTLDRLVDHIDHICDLTGNTSYVAIGSDLDGGVGRDEFPRDIDTIADLQALPELLTKRGYNADDVHAIMHGNWLGKLRSALPE